MVSGRKNGQKGSEQQSLVRTDNRKTNCSLLAAGIRKTAGNYANEELLCKDFLSL